MTHARRMIVFPYRGYWMARVRTACDHIGVHCMVGGLALRVTTSSSLLHNLLSNCRLTAHRTTCAGRTTQLQQSEEQHNNAELVEASLTACHRSPCRRAIIRASQLVETRLSTGHLPFEGCMEESRSVVERGSLCLL
jgi:hypothetical protein